MNKDFAFNELRKAFPSDVGELCKNQLLYYAWPQVFGSTSGPFGGIGGAAMTTFTIEAWAFNEFGLYFCNGKVLMPTADLTPGNFPIDVYRKTLKKTSAKGGA